MNSKNSKNSILRLSSVLGIATAGTLLSLPALALLQPESSASRYSTSSTEQLISQSTSGGAGDVGGGAGGVGGNVGGGAGNNDGGNTGGDTGNDAGGGVGGGIGDDGGSDDDGGNDGGGNDGSSSGGNLGGVRGQDSHGDGGLFEEVYPNPTINNPSTGGGGRPLGGA